MADNKELEMENDPLNDQGYQRKFGAHRPIFQGVAPDFFPHDCGNILLIFVITLAFYGILTLMFWGLIEWAWAVGTEEFAYAWIGIYCGFYFLVLIGMYFGGKGRQKAEMQMIKQQLEEEKKALQALKDKNRGAN